MHMSTPGSALLINYDVAHRSAGCGTDRRLITFRSQRDAGNQAAGRPARRIAASAAIGVGTFPVFLHHRNMLYTIEA